MSNPFGNEKRIRPYSIAHSGQLEVLDVIRANMASKTPASIIELICSRGWGKTAFVTGNVLLPYLNSTEDAKVMWVAPTYQIAMAPIDDFFKGTNESTGQRWCPEFDANGNRVWDFKPSTKSGPVLTWFTGGTVTFKSADAPDSIVSRGYNLIIIDEAALIQERVFTQQILGTARKAGIKIYIITTPRGRKHWTYKYFLKGQDPADVQYLSFQQSYVKNPFFSKILALLIKDLPDWLFRQEYLAEFIDDGDSVIRGVEDITFGEEIAFPTNQQDWEIEITDAARKTFRGEETVKAADRRFVVALDLAKSVDYTVFIVMDCDSGGVVNYKRFNKTDYRTILDLAATLCAKYNNAELIFDATGVGSGLADILNEYDISSVPFIFTNDSKVDLINKLIVSVEHRELLIPNIVTLKNELSAYTYTLTRTGKISYNAPSGMHDDTVIALALANLYRKENSMSVEAIAVDEVLTTTERRGPRNFIEECLDDDD